MADRNDSPPPGLLARKGEARPAMRPVNDNRPDSPAPSRIAIGPASTSIASGLTSGAMISAAIALAGGRGAAVTVRLDPARHLRLRLACAIGGSSAQGIIADALDAHLKTIPAIDRLMAEAMAGSGDQAVAGWGQE